MNSDPDNTFSFQPKGLGLSIFSERYTRLEGETWAPGVKRLAYNVALAEPSEKMEAIQAQFEDIIGNGLFMPGGRIWYGAGRPAQQMLNCFVVPTGDSREQWGKTLYDEIVVSGMGGGVGMNFSSIRGRNYPIAKMGGQATGSVSLMRMIDKVGDELVSGGGRRLALMMCLDINHPDIEEFINVKLNLKQLNNANISIIIPENYPTEQFVEDIKNRKSIKLQFNGRNDIFEREINLGDLWDLIVKNAHTNGEPGVLNSYLANHENNIAYSHKLVSTNPSMPAGTLVGTKAGIFPIEKLEGAEFSIKSLDGTWAPAKCFLSGENEEIFEISFSGNRKTHSTKQHKWPVMKKLGISRVSTEELKPGDLIPLNRPELPGINGDTTLTADEGFLLGYLLGDGWISQRENGKYTMGFVFGPDEKYLADKICNILNTLKPDASNVTSTDKDNCFYVQSTSQTCINTIINKYGWLGKNDIPSKVWESNDIFLQGFIDGLFSSDGYIAKTGSAPNIILTSKSNSFIQQVAKLLSFFGFSPIFRESIAKNPKFPNGKVYDREYKRTDLLLGRTQADLFRRLFTISHREKQNKLTNLANVQYRKAKNQGFVKVMSVTKVQSGKVWDISVDYKEHVFPSQWCYTGNCGEIWLPSYGCCCLGALVLPNFVKKGKFDFDLLDEITRKSVRFLDDVLTINHYPLPEIKAMCENERRIGLGVMGLHSMLMDLGMKYDSPESFEFVDKLFNKIKHSAYHASVDLAIEKGPFPLFDKKFLDSPFVKKLKPSLRNRIKEYGIRNCAMLTIAPTGTTSMVHGVSGGIETMFAPVFFRRRYVTTDQSGEKRLQKTLVVSKDYLDHKDIAQGAYDVSVRNHFEMQKVCQKHLDNACSKTINLPKDFPLGELSDIWLEYLPYMKGSTLYREGSRENEPMEFIPMDEAQDIIDNWKGEIEYENASLECPSGVCELK